MKTTASGTIAMLFIALVAATLTVRMSAQGGGGRAPDIAGEWRLD